MINKDTSITDLDHDMLLKAARLMEDEGGSFAGHIARAFYVADGTNKRLLLQSFSPLFEKFYRAHYVRNMREENAGRL
jgi:hypothetical protein